MPENSILPPQLKSEIMRQLDRLELVIQQIAAVEAERDAALAVAPDAATVVDAVVLYQRPQILTGGLFDSTVVRAHVSAAGAKGAGNQAIGRSRSGFPAKSTSRVISMVCCSPSI